MNITYKEERLSASEYINFYREQILDHSIQRRDLSLELRNLLKMYQ